MPYTETSEEDDYDLPETFLRLDEVAAPSPLLPRNKHGFVFFPDRGGGSSSRRKSSVPEDLEDVVRRKSAGGQDKEEFAQVRSQAVPDEELGLKRTESVVTFDEGADKLTALPRQDSWGNMVRYPTTTDADLPPPLATGALDRRQSLEERQGEKSETADSSIWGSPRAKRLIKFLTSLYTVSYLIIFSILGTLARVGLQTLTAYPGAPVTTPVLWANFAGSLIMGFLSEDRRLFMEEYGEKTNARLRHMEQMNNRRVQRRQERELVKGSRRYSQQASAPLPFSNSTTARLYPPQRVFRSKFMQRQPSAPSVVSDQTAPPDPNEEKKRHNAVKKTLPLYIGLATGFCGSLTSFSSFMRDAFLVLANSNPPYPSQLNGQPNLPDPRSGGYSVVALLAVLIYEPAISLSGFYVGGHLALGLDDYIRPIPFQLTNRFLDKLAIPLAVIMWGGAIVMNIFPPDSPGGPASGSGSTWETETWRGTILMALAFAPAGCILRFYISILLNARLPAFPLGTFVVNIAGSALLAILYALQHVPLSTSSGTLSGLSVSQGGSTPNLGGGNRFGCQMMQGAMDGFCGAFTTVSTWVAELNGLRRKHAWIYGLSSVAAGLAVVVVGMGPVRWGRGFEGTSCGI